MTSTLKPSSNWFALQKSLGLDRARKRRKIDWSASLSAKTSAFPRNSSSPAPKCRKLDCHNEHIDLEINEVKNGESIAALRRMVLGKVEHDVSQTALGKYLALDCEMVGVGIEGSESSLARVSIVNYTGAIVLDVFVRQRERVVDYRTQWSGVRSTDLAGSAKPFKEVQQAVANLIKDRILVGHAIYNDLKALLLSHPSPQVRDTQSLAYKHRVVRSRRPALRVLVKQELGIVIQGGEHNSVTDARATMALFRLYKKQWEGSFRVFHTNNKADDPTGKAITVPRLTPSSPSSFIRVRKRERPESSKFDDGNTGEMAEASSSSSPERIPSPSLLTLSTKKHHRPLSPTHLAQRKGISSGISTVTRRADGIKEVRRKGMRSGDGRTDSGSVVRNSSEGRKKGGRTAEGWWKNLGGKKGGIKL